MWYLDGILEQKEDISQKINEVQIKSGFYLIVIHHWFFFFFSFEKNKILTMEKTSNPLYYIYNFSVDIRLFQKK